MTHSSFCVFQYPLSLTEAQEGEIVRLCVNLGGYEVPDLPRAFFFRERPEGAIPHPLHRWFARNQIAYAWSDTGSVRRFPRVRLYAPAEKAEPVELPTIDGRIGLTVEDCAKPEKLALAQWGHALWKAMMADEPEAQLLLPSPKF